MGHIGVEKQGIAGHQPIDHVAMPVADFPLKHIQKLDSFMLKDRKDIGSLNQGDEIRLDDERAVARMSKKLILVPCPCSPSLDFETFPRPDESRVPHPLQASEQRSNGHLQSARQ